jgi:hypothetical protein
LGRTLRRLLQRHLRNAVTIYNNPLFSAVGAALEGFGEIGSGSLKRPATAMNVRSGQDSMKQHKNQDGRG